MVTSVVESIGKAMNPTLLIELAARSEIAGIRSDADAGDIRIDGQWVSDAIRRVRRARWLPHGLKRKRVDHPV